MFSYKFLIVIAFVVLGLSFAQDSTTNTTVDSNTTTTNTTVVASNTTTTNTTTTNTTTPVVAPTNTTTTNITTTTNDVATVVSNSCAVSLGRAPANLFECSVDTSMLGSSCCYFAYKNNTQSMCLHVPFGIDAVEFANKKLNQTYGNEYTFTCGSSYISFSFVVMMIAAFFF